MQSSPHRRLLTIISTILAGSGVVLLGLSLLPGGEKRIALPLVFLMLGGGFLLLEFVFSPEYRLAPILFIPGYLLLAFGIIFLLNVVTTDWNAWAYAWLLLLAGAGLGTALAGRRLAWRQEILVGASAVMVLGITFFALFGAIAGGLFIQVAAPILLVLGGLALRWTGIYAILIERLRQRRPEGVSSESSASLPRPVQGGLIEPLTTREVEVLSLIELGFSNAEIARRLTLAQSTVKTHINNIYGKLGVQTRTQAVRRARELGLLKQ